MWDSVKFLLPVLEKTLGRQFVLPARHGNSLEDIFRANPELKDVFIDGTERRVNKPKNHGSRDKLYSGKKKAHTRKHIVLSDERKFIYFLSQAKSGRRHDKRLMDKNQLARYIPDHVTAWTDTGFQGPAKLTCQYHHAEESYQETSTDTRTKGRQPDYCRHPGGQRARYWWHEAVSRSSRHLPQPLTQHGRPTYEAIRWAMELASQANKLTPIDNEGGLFGGDYLGTGLMYCGFRQASRLKSVQSSLRVPDA
jgi:hypothetical protein